MHNFAIISHTVCVHAGGPKNFGDAGTPPPWNWGVADPQKHTSIPHV